MAAQQIFIGIDAGGTQTVAAAVSGRARTLVAGGPGNFLAVGSAAFHALLRGLVKALRARAGIDPRNVSAVCVGGAGLG
ncbi:MAG: hypothetical protein GYA73_13285, partial [Planctomycetes bacterium]|nr:hypothetical protein [Planctomycetota bacterium]